MNCSLIVVGAHNGSKLEKLITEATKLGNVLLLEPVPWLFERLSEKLKSLPNIHFLNCAVTETDGEATFYAPTESASDVEWFGDQLGSLGKDHATAHNENFADKIREITVQGISFPTLVTNFGISEVDTLLTDTEGYDAKLLVTFPFSTLKPQKICFEHKHSDGFYNIGRNFARLISRLEEEGYKTRFLDGENCLAIKAGATAESPTR